MKNTALAPALPDAENMSLLIRTKNGDAAAKATFVEHNTRFMMFTARTYLNTGLDLDDLFQIACIGFLKAIDNFDLSKGVRFQTFSTTCMHNEILMFLRKNKRHLNLDSFDQTVLSYDASGQGDLLVQDMVGNWDQTTLDMPEREALRYALKRLQETGKLSKRDAMVLKLRYEDEMLQQDVAAKFNISQSYVSRLEKRAITQLRNLINK